VGVSAIFSFCKLSFPLCLTDYISVSWDTCPACRVAGGEEEL
jgi:hypothetical protein